jgi:hypothetical protein
VPVRAEARRGGDLVARSGGHALAGCWSASGRPRVQTVWNAGRLCSGLPVKRCGVFFCSWARREVGVGVGFLIVGMDLSVRTAGSVCDSGCVRPSLRDRAPLRSTIRAHRVGVVRGVARGQLGTRKGAWRRNLEDDPRGGRRGRLARGLRPARASPRPSSGLPIHALMAHAGPVRTS